MNCEPSHPWPVFRHIFQIALRGGKPKVLDFFFMGASATKSLARSRIFRYGLRNDILSTGQKSKKGGGALYAEEG